MRGEEAFLQLAFLAVGLESETALLSRGSVEYLAEPRISFEQEVLDFLIFGIRFQDDPIFRHDRIMTKFCQLWKTLVGAEALRCVKEKRNDAR